MDAHITLHPIRRGRGRQRGATAVEFALCAAIFLMMLLGAGEVGRLLWTWNAAGEATRLGARLAVVCDMNDADIKTRMRTMLGTLTNANIQLSYPAGMVTVTITGYTHHTFIPFVAMNVAMPALRTTLSRESMQSIDAAGTANPVCN